MGIYSNLTIGSCDFSWKGYIPDVVSLFFVPLDYRCIHHKSEGWYEHRFVSNCGDAKTRLVNVGISLDLIRQLHFQYFGFNPESYREALLYRLDMYLRHKTGKPTDVDSKFVKRMAQFILLLYFKPLSADQEFECVLALSRCQTASISDKDENDSKLSQAGNGSPTNSPNLAKLYRESLREYLRANPYTRHLQSDRYLTTGSDDLNLLYKVGVSIYSSPDDIPIEFEFSEFIDADGPMEPYEVNSMFAELRANLQTRTKWVTNAFLSRSPTGNTTSMLMPATQEFRTTKEKGSYLEELVKGVFLSQQGFVVKQNVRKVGEEIDLLIVNKLTDPFWLALQSPIILIECKHQKRKVEPKDLRNFEVKVIDRKAFCKLGVVVSTSGFTKGCFEVVGRTGRDGHKIILVDSQEIQRRIDEHIKTSDWLEQLILDQS